MFPAYGVNKNIRHRVLYSCQRCMFAGSFMKAEAGYKEQVSVKEFVTIIRRYLKV